MPAGRLPGITASEDPAAAHNRALAYLRADVRRFLGHSTPIKAALWLALLRPTDKVIADAAAGFAPVEGEDDSMVDKPAIIAFAEMALAKALTGDMQAWSLIADRIEGKPGLRRDEISDEAAAVRDGLQASIESIVSALTDAKLGRIVDVDVILDGAPQNRQDS